MIFFVANDGTVIASEPSPVYQGAADTDNIYLVAPFAEGLQAAVAFKLPNGVYTTRYPMSQSHRLTGIVDKQSGQTYNCWQYSMPSGLTQYYGTVTAQFFFYPEEGGVITPTSSVSFVVGKGVPSIKPTAPGDDVFDAIMSNLSELSKQLNNGAFTARAIYQWNSTYVYGAGEITYYPLGEYGVFIKSLVANNAAEPYVNGVIDGDAWQSVSDLNILNELYGLKGELEEGVRSAQSNAAMAVQSAASAQNSANIAQNAAESLKSNADYIESVKNGTLAVPKAVNDSSGENIANQFASVNSDIDGLREDISNEAHFRGMFDSVAALKEAYPTATPNDYAYIVGGNIWIYGANGWTDSGEASPNTSVPASNATPLMDGAASAGSLSQYARGDHRHPSDTTKANTVGEYPNMSVGAATNDGTDRNIAETADKNLYNLGAFDTVVSNGDGTATVTRRTGYLTLTPDDINAFVPSGIAPYPNWYATINTLSPTNVKFDSSVTNGAIRCVVAPISAGINTFTMFALTNQNNNVQLSMRGSQSYSSSEEVKSLVFSQGALTIQYELADTYQYTEQVIDNRPLNNLPQAGERWLHEEWEKGLNIWNEKWENGAISPVNGNNVSDNTWIRSIDYIAVKSSVPYYMHFPIQTRVCYYDSSKNFISAGYPTVGVVTVPAGTAFLRFAINQSTYGNNIMIAEGRIPYPYAPYNGGIVREKTLEDYLPKTGGDINGSLSVSGTVTEGGKRVYSENNPPPLYVHYFMIPSAYSTATVVFTIMSRKAELLSNAEILDLLPDNTNAFNNLFGIPATGQINQQGGSALNTVDKVYKYDGKLYIRYFTDGGAYGGREITENLASASYQKVMPLV